MDIRTEAARYYDLNPDTPDDVPFYQALVSSPQARVLELGCGTGRVLLPLAKSCAYIHGLDQSESMIAICQKKLQDIHMPVSRAQVEIADITRFAVNQKFDLIIAPYRVLQNIESDDAVNGLFDLIRQHLAPGGSSILNVFRPYADATTLRREWCNPNEKLSWEIADDGDRVVCSDRRPRMHPAKMILYPELIYRRYRSDRLVDEARLNIVMRCYYPDDFIKLIETHGFRIVNKWGGYKDEPYGVGSELVVHFTI